jgi:hypothetical protein
MFGAPTVVVVVNLLYGTLAPVMLCIAMVPFAVVVVVHDFRGAMMVAGLRTVSEFMVINVGFVVLDGWKRCRVGICLGYRPVVPVGEDVLADDSRSQAHGEPFPAMALFGAGVTG